MCKYQFMDNLTQPTAFKRHHRYKTIFCNKVALDV